MRTRSLAVPWLCACLVAPVEAQGLEPEDVANPIAGLFAGLNAITLSESLTGSNYRVDGRGPSSDTRIRVLKLPWSRELDVGAQGGTLFVELVAGLLTADETLVVDTASGRASVRQDWLSWGLQTRFGWTFPLGSGWAVRPGLLLGLSRVENDAEFDPVAEVELAPAIDGILVNWEGWAASYGSSLEVLHEGRLGELRTSFQGRYSWITTDVFDASSAFQEGMDTSGFYSLRTTVEGTTGWTSGGQPVGWDAFSGAFGLHDLQDALGFGFLWELGGGLRFAPVRGLPALRIGGSWLVGAGVEGWSLSIWLAP